MSFLQFRSPVQIRKNQDGQAALSVHHVRKTIHSFKPEMHREKQTCLPGMRRINAPLQKRRRYSEIQVCMLSEMQDIFQENGNKGGPS